MSKHIVIILIMAVATYFSRAVPALLGKQFGNSGFLGRLLYFLPFAALGALVFPGILTSTGNLWSAIIGGVVATALAFFVQNLIVVIAGSVAAVYLFSIFIRF